MNPLTLIYFLQTVASNKKNFSKKDIEKAQNARTLQQQLGFPGTSTLTSYLRMNLMTNTSVTIDDVHRGEQIFGPLPQLIKGKCVDSNRLYSVPSSPTLADPLIVQQCSNLALFADYFYVNGVCFLLTNTEKLGFLMSTFCERTGGLKPFVLLNMYWPFMNDEVSTLQQFMVIMSFNPKSCMLHYLHCFFSLVLLKNMFPKLNVPFAQLRSVHVA